MDDPEQTTDGDIVLAPVEPHDALGFERLAENYNFLNISSYGRVLANLVVDEARRRPGCRVLDIGCGGGIGRDVQLQWAVRRACGELWGVEPDRSITPAEGLFDKFQHALMETADLPAASIGVAYSSMVMEHVADPAAFLAALGACLEPGGAYLFVTPNAESFVPKATKVLHQLRLDELTLRLLRGKQLVDEYHYPVQFRFNSPRQITRHAEAAGFATPEFAYFEGSGSHSYLRGPLAPLRPLLIAKRRKVRRPCSLATMVCRLTKPA